MGRKIGHFLVSYLQILKHYIRFLTYAIASNDETIDHLENLFETGSLEDVQLYENLHDRIEILGKKLNNFIQKIEKDLANKK
jgi:four helix bundle protein